MVVSHTSAGTPKPSPLGRVAEHKRGRERFVYAEMSYVFKNCTALFRQPLRAATFPKGEGFDALNYNL